MKNKSNSMKNWEHLDNNWKDKLAEQEEALSEGLLQRFEQKLVEKEHKNGYFFWLNSKKWIAAASLILGLLFTYNFWNQNDDLKIQQTVSKIDNSIKQLDENKRVFQIVKKDFVAKISNQHHSDLKVLKKNPIDEVESVKLEVIPNMVDVSDEKIATVMQSLPTETHHLLPEQTPDTPSEEKIFVVEIEKTPKKKFLKRALDFIEKVKEGKLVQAVQAKNKKEEGKMNDEIHQVLNKIVEKEENIKRYISL